MTPERFSPDKYYILHGCPPSEELITPKEKRWMNWLADQLQKRGLDAVAPDMPVSWEPKYAEWEEEFDKYPVSEKTVIVAHSCSGAFIVQYLAKKNFKIHKLILVAPAKVPENDQDKRQDLYNFDLPSSGAQLADEVVVFISDDFPHHMQAFELYKAALNPRVIQFENKKHFLFFQMGTNEFPELLEEVLK